MKQQLCLSIAGTVTPDAITGLSLVQEAQGAPTGDSDNNLCSRQLPKALHCAVQCYYSHMISSGRRARLSFHLISLSRWSFHDAHTPPDLMLNAVIRSAKTGINHSSGLVEMFWRWTLKISGFVCKICKCRICKGLRGASSLSSAELDLCNSPDFLIEGVQEVSVPLMTLLCELCILTPIKELWLGRQMVPTHTGRRGVAMATDS